MRLQHLNPMRGARLWGQKARAFLEGGQVCARMGILGSIDGGRMIEGKYPIQQNLAHLKRTLDSDPTNIEAANRYWAELSALGGNDVRGGGFVIEAFRGCALASQAGAVAFARAYRELFEKSGEKPRAELFDEELIHVLKTRLSALSNEDQAIVQWVLESIK